MNFWKIARITLLLAIFVAVAFYAKVQKLQARTWTEPLQVVIYPLNGDNGAAEVDQYINDLNDDVFQPVDRFLQQQSRDYIAIEHPTETRLGPVLKAGPPEAPPPGSHPLSILWWSLKLRYWAWANTPDDGSNLHRIRVFAYYHLPRDGRHLQHSLGLDKGLLAIVHVFAGLEQDQQNNVVITHELLHTVGATDHYYLATHQPLYPGGYADPERSPLHPQKKAEIMAVGIPISETESKMAASLDQCVIGEQTLREINWQ